MRATPLAAMLFLALISASFAGVSAAGNHKKNDDFLEDLRDDDRPGEHGRDNAKDKKDKKDDRDKEEFRDDLEDAIIDELRD